MGQPPPLAMKKQPILFLSTDYASLLSQYDTVAGRLEESSYF